MTELIENANINWRYWDLFKIDYITQLRAKVDDGLAQTKQSRAWKTAALTIKSKAFEGTANASGVADASKVSMLYNKLSTHATCHVQTYI